MKELYRFRQFLTEGVIKEEQMGSYKKFLKVVKSYEDEEILSDFLDSYPKGQDISKSEYERFTEKHLGLSDPEDYRGENWKYIMSEGKLLKEEKYSGAIIRKGTSDKAKEDTKIVRQALKDKGIKFTNRGEFGMDFKDADLAQIKKIIADAKVGEFIVSRDVNEGIIKENTDFPELEDEFEGAMDAMVVEPEVYLQDIIDASTEEIVSDDYYEIMNAVEQGVYSKDEAVKLAKSWAKEKLSTLSEGVVKEDYKNDIKEGVDIDQMKIEIEDVASYLEDVNKEEEVMSNVLDRHDSDPFETMGEVYAYLDGLLQKY